MRVLKSMLDSLDVPGANIPFEGSKILKKLATLEESIPTKDDTHLYDMHQKIITLLSDLQMVKEALYESRDDKAEIEEYKEALDDCNDDLEQLRRELRLK
jgi:hypothetical protein